MRAPSPSLSLSLALSPFLSLAAVHELPQDKLEGEEALNDFFQQIYGRGDPEIRRAMNKSFVESGGTVLSTNWTDVGSKTVEGTPPAGLEMKKWTDVNK